MVLEEGLSTQILLQGQVSGAGDIGLLYGSNTWGGPRCTIPIQTLWGAPAVRLSWGGHLLLGTSPVRYARALGSKSERRGGGSQSLCGKLCEKPQLVPRKLLLSSKCWSTETPFLVMNKLHFKSSCGRRNLTQRTTGDNFISTGLWFTNWNCGLGEVHE